MEEYPRNLAEIIGSGSRVIITIATAGTDKRVRLGRIIEYDALNKIISVQQEDNTICLVPLASVSSIETLRNTSSLSMIKKLVKEQ